jgi:hypothetical protein
MSYISLKGAISAMTQGVLFIAEQSFKNIEQAVKCAFSTSTARTNSFTLYEKPCRFSFLCSFAVIDYLNFKEKVWNNK